MREQGDNFAQRRVMGFQSNRSQQSYFLKGSK